MPLRTLPPFSPAGPREHAGRLELLRSRRAHIGVRCTEIIPCTLLSAALNYSTFNQFKRGYIFYFHGIRGFHKIVTAPIKRTNKWHSLDKSVPKCLLPIKCFAKKSRIKVVPRPINRELKRCRAPLSGSPLLRMYSSNYSMFY